MKYIAALILICALLLSGCVTRVEVEVTPTPTPETRSGRRRLSKAELLQLAEDADDFEVDEDGRISPVFKEDEEVLDEFMGKKNRRLVTDEDDISPSEIVDEDDIDSATSYVDEEWDEEIADEIDIVEKGKREKLRREFF